MIYVSQGHERGIGLEILFKAILQLPHYITSIVEVHANTQQVEETAQFLGFKVHFSESKIIFQGVSVGFKHTEEETCIPLSTTSLRSILSIIKPHDILITLPTSKDQLYLDGVRCSGYTEFFRTFFNDRDIAMLFHSNDIDVLLLTDHIPLTKVISALTIDLISKKLENTIAGLKRHFTLPEDIIISGINPHAGEGGILGHEDSIINDSLRVISSKFPQISFQGPIPGDTLHFHRDSSKKQLLVYSYHDQGLPFFKEKYGLFGINVTMGLPFLRLSVDHGTAFNLYGKNIADSGGLLHVFYSAYEVLNR